MASVDKYTHDSVCNLLRHNNRTIINNSNKEIDKSRTHLNYSFEMQHDDKTNYEYYNELRDNTYLYGRGTNREKEIITACGWVVTLPKEISGNPVKEKEFFRGVYDFILERYGKENIINNAVHYDEGGLPHIHVIFCPVTELNHDLVQHKTVKTKRAVRLESGRYEYESRFKLDDAGEKIKLKNYAKMSDYYDTKLDCNSVLNPVELKHFHQDLQHYLSSHGVEGAVVNGKTGGINFSVKELKSFTEKTGLTLPQVKEMIGDKTLLEGIVDKETLLKTLEQAVLSKNAQITALKEEIKVPKVTPELAQKDAQIKQLSERLSDVTGQYQKVLSENMSLNAENYNLEQNLATAERELAKAKELIAELSAEKTQVTSQPVQPERGWGNTSTWERSSTWGDTSGWGNNTQDTTHNSEEKLWS